MRTPVVPKDAILLDRISNGEARRLYDAALKSAKQLVSARAACNAWSTASAVRRFLGRRQREAEKRALAAVAKTHQQNLDAYVAMVSRTRQSDAYQSAVAVQPRPAESGLPATIAERETRTEEVQPADDESSFCLTVSPVPSVVEHMFTPRPRPDPLPHPPGSNAAGRVYLPIAAVDLPAAHQAGAVRGPRGGVFVPPGLSLDPFEPWLPFYARRMITPLHVDLIPSTNWGGSLANLLTPSSWDSIREGVLNWTGGNCVICGFNGGKSSVDCHEIWQYYLPIQGDTGVQRLRGIIPVCRLCHSMFHLGKANVDGHLDKVLGRLGWANRWTKREVDHYCRYVDRKHGSRNRWRWNLDVSVLGANTALKLKGGGKGVNIAVDGTLHYNAATGPGSTRMIGVPFGRAGEPEHPPLPPVDYDQYQVDL